MSRPIAIIGTGLIGSGFAQRLLGLGKQVVVYNRTPSKLASLVALGARPASSAAEALAGVERVHLVLRDDASVDSVLSSALGTRGPDAVIVDHTTTEPSATRARAERLRVQGVHYVHAPIFMGPANAQQGTGLMLACGDSALVETVRPELLKMTSDLWYLGPDPGRAAAFKLVGNCALLSLVGAVADLFAIARHSDVEPGEALALFERFSPAGVLSHRARRMADHDFDPSFTLDMARKDIEAMLTAAGGAPLAVLPSLAQRMDVLLAQGLGALDVGVLGQASGVRDGPPES